MKVRDILPQILATLTGSRYQVVRGRDFEWSDNSWTHNAFRVYELIFGRRYGIRHEMSASCDHDGNTIYAAHSREAVFALAERYVRDLFLSWQFAKIYIPIMQTTQGIPVFASPYLFAIANTNSAQSTRTGSPTTNTLSSYSITGSNVSLFVGVDVAQSADVAQCTGVTANGVSMGSEVGHIVISTGGVGNVYLFNLVGAATGNIVATKNSALSELALMASSYSGVSQGALDNSSTAGPSSSSNFTQSVASNTANAWGLVFNGNGTGNPTAGTNNLLRLVDAGGYGYFMGDTNSDQASGGFSMQTLGSGTRTWGGIMAAFAPFTAAGPANVKTKNGVTQSTGIKTYEGLALASVKSVEGVT